MKKFFINFFMIMAIAMIMNVVWLPLLAVLAEEKSLAQVSDAVRLSAVLAALSACLHYIIVRW